MGCLALFYFARVLIAVGVAWPNRLVVFAMCISLCRSASYLKSLELVLYLRILRLYIVLIFPPYY